MSPKLVAETYASVVSASELREQRIAAGLTIRGLANAIGAHSHSALHRLELPVERGGRTTLSAERAVKIIVALGIPPHQVHHYFRFHGVEAGVA